MIKPNEPLNNRFPIGHEDSKFFVFGGMETDRGVAAVLHHVCDNQGILFVTFRSRIVAVFFVL